MTSGGALRGVSAKLAAALVLVMVVLHEASLVQGKRFDRCGLVRELRRQDFPSDKMRDWVCLVEAESSRDTSKVGPRNKNGSYDYGLFQINSRYWCGISKKGGDCNIKCSDLTNDNISDDSTCAKKIYKRHGFTAWYGWKNKCNGKPLPDISKC